MSERGLVVVAGSCMTDLISYVSRLPKPGETIHGSSFIKGFGGKGANQCVMAARLGAPAAMVAKVGDDTFGHSTVQNFKDNKVNCDHVIVTSEAPSGVASITVNEDGENAIVIVSGANGALGPADVGRADPLLSRAAVVVCQLEVPPQTSLAALTAGKRHGALTILNTAPGVESLSEEFYSNTDILCLNETEAELLTGLPVPDLASGYQAVRELQSRGPGCVVLTLGEKGVLFTELGAETKTTRHIEALKVDVIDTTGAGDAFVGALAYFLACHPSLAFDEMVRRSGVIASHTVTYRGTQSSYCVDKLPRELIAHSSPASQTRT